MANTKVKSEARLSAVNGNSTKLEYQDLLRTGPGTLAGRYLRTFWQPVYRAQDLEPGAAKPIRLMGADLTLYRGEERQAHVVAFRCAHRGAQLSVGWVEGDDIRCFYHGWKYNRAGQCIDQPAERAPFCQKVKICAYPTEEYLGLIFVYMGDGPAPTFPRIPEYENPEYPRYVTRYVWRCNYFTQIENALDRIHTHFVHWHFGFRVPEEMVAKETDMGLLSHAKGMGISVRSDQSFFHMPNAHEWSNPPHYGTSYPSYVRGWRVPFDDDHHIRYGVEVVPIKGVQAKRYMELRGQHEVEQEPMSDLPEEILAGQDSFRNFKKPPYPKNFVNIQDYVAMVSLGPIASEPPIERLGTSDVGVIAIRNLWRRELRRFQQGQPLKQWIRPDELWGNVREAVASASPLPK